MRKRRLKLGLTQKQVARALKVTPFSIGNWEQGDFQPNLPIVLHRIITFLGYDPEPPTVQNLADPLRAKRRQLGWGQRELAQHLGVDGSTVTTLTPNFKRQLPRKE